MKFQNTEIVGQNQFFIISTEIGIFTGFTNLEGGYTRITAPDWRLGHYPCHWSATETYTLREGIERVKTAVANAKEVVNQGMTYTFA